MQEKETKVVEQLMQNCEAYSAHLEEEMDRLQQKLDGGKMSFGKFQKICDAGLSDKRAAVTMMQLDLEGGDNPAKKIQDFKNNFGDKETQEALKAIRTEGKSKFFSAAKSTGAKFIDNVNKILEGLPEHKTAPSHGSSDESGSSSD